MIKENPKLAAIGEVLQPGQQETGGMLNIS